MAKASPKGKLQDGICNGMEPGIILPGVPNSIYLNNYGGRSSVGRVPDCDSGRRGFEPHRPPHTN